MFLHLVEVSILISVVITTHVRISKDCQDNSQCMSTCCQTLEYVLKNMNLNNSVLSLESDQHLTRSHEFWYLRNLTLTSTIDNQITCHNRSGGFLFLFSQRITISNVIITNCGVDHISTTTGFKINNDSGPFNVTEVIRFTFCQHINILNASFIKNVGVALSLYDSNGTITILNCTFKENSNFHLQNRSRKIISGGGVHIEYTPCGAIDPFSCTKEAFLNEYNHDSLITIQGSTFSGNIADNSTDHVLMDNEKGDIHHITFGMGGAIGVYLFGSSYENNIRLIDCTMNDNRARWGGAVCVTLRDKTSENNMQFNKNGFSNNTATYGGGAVRIHSYVKDVNLKLKGTLIRMNDVLFEKNHAIWGGALSIAGVTRLIYHQHAQSRDTFIQNCTFKGNTATVGFAVGLSTWDINHDASGPGMSYRVNFTDTSFIGNKFIYTEDEKTIGQGALYSDEVTIVFNGKNYFLSNDHTALAITSSSINFLSNSYTSFENNTGNEGGAIALYGTSWLRLMENSSLLFKRNKVHSKGGAIYYKFHGPPRISFQTTQLQTSQCFIRYGTVESSIGDYNSWKTNVTFFENSASPSSGSSVYASTLQFCRPYDNSRDATKALNWTFVTYKSINKTNPEVVTTAIEIEINKDQWNVVPGMKFSPEANLLDEKKQSVYGTLEIEILADKDPPALDPPNNQFLIRNKFSQLQLDGKEGSSFQFSLKTTSGQLINTKKFESSMKECLLGFQQPVNSTKCVCMKDEYSDVISCESNGGVYLLKGKWGYRDNRTGKLRTTVCPEYYCTCHSDNKDEFKCLFKKKDQCASNREGILCSQCKNGLSVKFGNEGCEKCSNKYLFLLIPGFVFFSLFVIFILYFNFDAFSGYLNAFLYCYQMIMLLLPENLGLDPFISLIIDITSLSGTGGAYGFCFFDGMDNLQKTAINYIIPSYMLLFTILVGYAMPTRMWKRFFHRESKQNQSEIVDRNKSFGSALSFVLVICYSSFTKVTIQLLNCVEINGKTRMFRAAFAECFVGEHIWYGLLAILVLVFVVLLFPIILLFTRFFTYRFQLIQRLEPIWNTLKDCFKESSSYRMFAAFYLICRLILLAGADFVADLVNRMVFINLANIVFLVFFISVQPYKRKTYNFWDSLLLTNMCVISLLSLVLSIPYAASHITSSIYGKCLKVAIYVPILTVVLRLLSHIFNRILQKPTNPETRSSFSGTSKISGRIRRWRNNRKSVMRIPERVVEDFESDYVEFQ